MHGLTGWWGWSANTLHVKTGEGAFRPLPVSPTPTGVILHGYRVRECISSIRVKPTLHGHPVYRQTLARPLITILRTVAYETIMRAYRYRLYPSTSQTTLLEQTLEICRWVYNDTLSDRVHSCPHCGLVMDRDQNAGVQYYEIGAAISGITSQDAPDERRGSSHENCATISENCKNTAVVSVLLVGVTITPGVNQKTKTQKVAEW